MSVTAVTTAVRGITEVISPLFDRLFPDPIERERKLAEVRRLEQSGELELFSSMLEADKAQMAVNQQEAQHASLFVAGARPFILWVCGVAMAYHFIAQPMLAFLLAAAGNNVQLPTFDMETLNTVLFGLLGLSGMRTVEKVKGVARNSAPVTKLPWQK